MTPLVAPGGIVAVLLMVGVARTDRDHDRGRVSGLGNLGVVAVLAAVAPDRLQLAVVALATLTNAAIARHLQEREDTIPTFGAPADAVI